MFCVTIFFFSFSHHLRARHTQYRFTVILGRQPKERGAARLQSPFPFRVFSPSPPLSSFPIPLYAAPKAAHSHNAAQNGEKPVWRLKSWEQSKNIRSPQEWGGLWKREYGCRSHPGKPVLRKRSTQSIRERKKKTVTEVNRQSVCQARRL